MVSTSSRSPTSRYRRRLVLKITDKNNNWRFEIFAFSNVAYYIQAKARNVGTNIRTMVIYFRSITKHCFAFSFLFFFFNRSRDLRYQYSSVGLRTLRVSIPIIYFLLISYLLKIHFGHLRLLIEIKSWIVAYNMPSNEKGHDHMKMRFCRAPWTYLLSIFAVNILSQAKNILKNS